MKLGRCKRPGFYPRLYRNLHHDSEKLLAACGTDLWRSRPIAVARAISGWPITIDGTISVPVWASWIACIVAGSLAYLGLRLLRTELGMNDKTVLISGAGIAGPTLAFWLKAAGFEPTVVEHAPAPRTGGYVIDFWGLGYDIAERMGLLGDINRIGYHVREVRIVGDRGARVTGFGTKVFDELTGGRFVTLGRSDLSRLLLKKIEDTTEIIFGDAIVDLREHADHVEVKFKHAADRRFDLVIGADGLHSNVRRLVFGSQNRFEKQLGYLVAAFEVRGYRPRNEDVYLMHNEPRRMVGRFALHDDRTLFLFVFVADADF